MYLRNILCHLRKLLVPKSYYVRLFFVTIIWVVMVVIYLRKCKTAIIESGWLNLSHDALNGTSLEIPSNFLFSKYGVVRNHEDQHTRDIGYKRYSFNALVSNNIGEYRQVPDTRHKLCRLQQYEENLPTASVIMCFYNEHKMTLIRSIKTIMERTPATYLKEIILVDDFSDLPDLQSGLQHELNAHLHYSHLRYVRTERREGLIRARVIGARLATADVLIFLDSHIEVNRMWAEPLLQQIKNENDSLAVPVIDIINADTFEYTSSPLVRGGFNWGLHFKWENLPEGTLRNETDFKGPFRSPTMAGGLFAVSRLYFQHIGEYDMGMDIWGGENLEISFRVWQCGGTIKIVPCSRVGHIFRKHRPYSSPDGRNTMLKNSLRLAHVWMDDYKQHFLSHDKLSRSYDYGNITDRLQLRERLQCHPFEWYVKNVYPELRVPGDEPKQPLPSQPFQPWHSRKRNYVKNYLLRLSGTQLCASVQATKVKGFWKRRSGLILQPCVKSRNQIWYETDKSEIILDKQLCLEAEGDKPLVSKCHEMLGDQQWLHDKENKVPIYNTATGTCLRAVNAKEDANIMLDLCAKNYATTWDIVLL